MTVNEQKAYELSDVLAAMVISLVDVVSEEEHEKIDSKCVKIVNCLWELTRYKDLGTIEEFKALKEKNTKKRFNIFESHGMRQFVCGCCDRPILTTDNYCSFCGQKLDWQ